MPSPVLPGTSTLPDPAPVPNFSKPLSAPALSDPLTGGANNDSFTHAPQNVNTAKSPAMRRGESDSSLASFGVGPGALKEGVIGGRVAVGGTDG